MGNNAECKTINWEGKSENQDIWWNNLDSDGCDARFRVEKKLDFRRSLKFQGVQVHYSGWTHEGGKRSYCRHEGWEGKNLFRLKESTIVDGAGSKTKTHSIEVELGGTKSSGGPKLIERRNEHIRKKVSFAVTTESEDPLCCKDGGRRNKRRWSLQKKET